MPRAFAFHSAIALSLLLAAGCPGDDVTPSADGDSSSDGGATTAVTNDSSSGSISMSSMTSMSTTSGLDSSDGISTTPPTTDTGDDATTGNPPVCGNNILEGDEECDLTQLDGETCESLGFDSGQLACTLTCLFNTEPCGVCGNDEIEDAEACDGTQLMKQDCVSLGFFGGTLACASDCTDFDTSGCIPIPMCGNDLFEPTEVCDGTDLAGQTCVTQGFADGGTLVCDGDCLGFDVTGCDAGTGDCCAANGTPGCDDNTCESTICAADPTCCSGNWDAGCANMALFEPACFAVGGSCPDGTEVCGNDLVEPLETCDGTDLGGEDCVSQGFAAGGTLVCLGDCSGYDTGLCDGGSGDCCAANGSAGCDDNACEAAICAVMPACCSTNWAQACATAAVTEPACFAVGGSCPDGTEVGGDGVAELPEECDGADLAGQDCVSVGFPAGGPLSCAGDCTFDTSSCDPGSGDCCISNGSPGCNNAACEAAVCAIDPFCCNTSWDGICAGEAQADPICGCP